MSYIVLGGKVIKNNKKEVREIINKTFEFSNKASIKGVRGKNCHVLNCPKSGATWWNPGPKSYCCKDCAEVANKFYAIISATTRCISTKPEDIVKEIIRLRNGPEIKIIVDDPLL